MNEYLVQMSLDEKVSNKVYRAVRQSAGEIKVFPRRHISFGLEDKCAGARKN
jgi:hypothetical protein